MLTRRALLTALPLAHGLTAKPSPERQTEFLREASATALLYTRKLPNFICTETIRRSDNLRGTGWRLKDTLGVQIGIANDREYYKLVSRNGSPTKLSYREVGGAITEGEFGSLLAEIFHPGVASFRFSKAFQLAGRSTWVFDYRVPPGKATYHLEYASRAGKSQSIVVGHRGLVWIDEGTARVTHVEQTAQIPRHFPLRISKTILDFAWFNIAGIDWLMPRHSSSTMGSSEVLTRNEVDFSDYRKFAADSSLIFDAPGPNLTNP